MIGAPHIDHVVEAAVELGLVIGDVGREVGVGAVRLLQRPVHIVAKGGGAEQRLLAILVIFDRRAFRRRQAAFIDIALGAQSGDGGADAILAGGQRTLGEKYIVPDVEGGEIALDHVHHHRDGGGAHHRKPFGLLLLQQFVAMLFGQSLAHRLEIIAGIKPVGNFADRLAEGLAVTQERRPRQDIDLRAGIVDVIFARDVIARERQQARQRIAEHRAATMTDMHRPGRIGGDVFDVDLLARTDRDAAIGIGVAQHSAQRVRPCRRLEHEIDEARPGDIDAGHQVVGAQFDRKGFGQIARLGLGVLRQHHRGVGRHVAMARIARQFHHDARQIGVLRQYPFIHQHAAGGADPRQHVREKMQG